MRASTATAWWSPTSEADNDDGATDVALQGDGKIVAAGHTDAGDNPQNFALARYTPTAASTRASMVMEER